jgi:hypothetical protein
MRTIVVAVACLALAGACGGSGGNPRRGEGSPADTNRFVDKTGIAVDYPPGWHVSTQPLTEVVWPPQRLAAASFSLDGVEPGPNCSPTPAYEAMPSDGALIQLIEYTPNSDPGANPGNFPPRPPHFRLDPEAFQNFECYGESYNLVFADAGRKFQAQVKLGARTSPETVRTLLAVLDSLDISAR